MYRRVLYLHDEEYEVLKKLLDTERRKRLDRGDLGEAGIEAEDKDNELFLVLAIANRLEGLEETFIG